MALKAQELAALEGLLTGISSLPVRSGSFGKGGGVASGDIEDSLRMLINDEDFMEEFSNRENKAADSAARKGRKAGIKRGMEVGSKGKGLLGAGGKVAGRLGSKLLVGGGLLGTGLMVADVIQMLIAGSKDPSYERLRASNSGDFESALRSATGPRDRDRLESSQMLRRHAGHNSSIRPRMSSELRRLIDAGQAQELGQIKQQMKPGIREAYARMGLVA